MSGKVGFRLKGGTADKIIASAGVGIADKRRAKVGLNGRVIWERQVVRYTLSGVVWFIDVGWARGYCVAVVKRWDCPTPVAVHRFHPSWMAVRGRQWAEEELMKYLARKAATEAKRDAEVSSEHASWLKAHEALGEYLTSTEYPDGGKRQTATVLLFVEDGQVKCCLRDRDTDRSLWVTAGSVPDALLALDDALRSEEPQWRKNAPYTPGGKKKK